MTGINTDKIIAFLTDPPKGKKAKRKWERERLEAEIARLNRLLWVTLTKLGGGDIRITVDDVITLPELASVTITPAVDGVITVRANPVTLERKAKAR